jgi:type IV secretory pathway VirB3-like protein
LIVRGLVYRRLSVAVRIVLLVLVFAVNIFSQLTLAALWAVRELGQKDDATLAALISRLDFKHDPKWVTGNIVGALTDPTDKRFGYDRDA